MLFRVARFALAAALVGLLVLTGGANQDLTPAQLREDVEGVAAVVEREYFDEATARRVASTIRERLSTRRYGDAKTSGELAVRLTRDLVAETNDKHLHVALIPPATPESPPGSDADRARRGRRANFGVRRVEILPGNVGYVDLTSFFRLSEARDAIAAAMQLLQHADALIVDLRANGGGSPDTVAYLVTHFFAEPNLALFDIVPRTGTPESFTTAPDASIARNASRPMYALTSTSTFSAGEGLAFILQERRRAVVVGERTAGAANPGRPYPASDRLQVTVPNGQVRTAVTGRNWEGTGVTPDVTIAAADALRRAQAMALRELIDKTTDTAWRVSLERHLREVEGALQPELAKQRLEDLATFEERVFKVDRSYDEKERAQAAEKIAALRNSAATLSPAQFELALAEIVALAHNAHSAVQSGRWGARFNRVPVSFILFDDGLRVGSSEADPDLRGLAVEAIAGKSLDDLRQAWSRYQPGPSGWRDQHIVNFIESPELLHAASMAPSAESVEVAFRRDDGSRFTRTLRASDGGELARNSREIEFAPAGIPRPLYLQEPDAIVRYIDLADRDAVYIQFRRNFDPLDRAGFRKRVDDLAVRVKGRRPRFVVVDQRFNSGGDLNNTRDLMKAIPACVKNDGRVFVITSGRTFSAAISSVGYLKQAGGPRVTIVGKPVGDVLDFWAEGSVVILPHSRASVSYSTERHNYQTGCPEPECHPPIQRHPIAVKTLAPDLSPAFTWAAFAAGRDPYLEAVFELMRR